MPVHCLPQLMRVAEFRQAGYSEKISLARGMSMTGGIITAAGVIMAIAFGALIFSQVHPHMRTHAQQRTHICTNVCTVPVVTFTDYPTVVLLAQTDDLHPL